MLGARTSTALARAAARPAVRNLSTKEPKLHMAKHHWTELQGKRPVQQDELHLVFHPPYDKKTVSFILAVVIIGGWGTMEYGYYHQQYKQGYFK